MAEQAYLALGAGGWVDNAWVVKECPLCGEHYTFHFAGLTGMWVCNGCNKNGDFKDLKFVAKDDILLVDRVAELIQPTAPKGLIQVGSYIPPPQGQSISTGFNSLDKKIDGITMSELYIVAGKSGAGKSTMTSQIALNMIEVGARVCFYSGELSAARFQRWMTRQAAGQKYCKPFINQFGAERYAVETHISQLVHSWFMDKLILYDNSVRRSSERSSILERFVQAKKYFDCNVFFVDNLMTAKYTKDTERDYWRQQSNFVSELIDFAHQENVAVILVAHPKKMDTGNFNDNIAGSSEITNKADNIMTIQRLFDEKEIAENGCETVVTVSKDREEGEIAKLGFNFDKSSKRFIPKSGSYTERYGWEDL